MSLILKQYRSSENFVCIVDKSSILNKACVIQKTGFQNQHCMLRYIMSFSVMEGRQHLARKIIEKYFDQLHRQGPGGMRSQCYSSNDDDKHFVHIKSFKKEAAANHHFRTQPFKEYIEQLSSICEASLFFSKLHREEMFESIY